MRRRAGCEEALGGDAVRRARSALHAPWGSWWGSKPWGLRGPTGVACPSIVNGGRGTWEKAAVRSSSTSGRRRRRPKRRQPMEPVRVAAVQAAPVLLDRDATVERVIDLSETAAAMGDGSTLTVLDTPFGRLGGLTCWENYMPLARAAMYAQGIDIYLAPTWDNSDVWVATLRHIAKEARIYVIGVNSCIRGADVPAD